MLIDLAPPVAGAAHIADLADQLRLPQGYAAEPEGAARLGRLATAALSLIEARTGRALSERRFLLRCETWPVHGRIEVPVAPVKAVDGLAVVDADGLRTAHDPALLRLDALGSVPAASARRPNRLPPIPLGGYAELEVLAGYGPDWLAVPADLRLAVTLLGAALHDSGLDAGTVAMPFGVLALIEPFRRVRL